MDSRLSPRDHGTPLGRVGREERADHAGLQGHGEAQAHRALVQGREKARPLAHAAQSQVAIGLVLPQGEKRVRGTPIKSALGGSHAERTGCRCLPLRGGKPVWGRQK